MSTSRDRRALLLVGAVGVGKTTTAEALGGVLEEQGVPGAVIDLDAIRRIWPAPPGDRFNSAIELANLRAMARTFLEAGAQVLVAAGVIEERAARAQYEEAMGAPLTVVRLVAPRELVRARLRHRHDGEPEALAWHLDRYDELTAILDAAGVEDMCVQVVGDPRDTARAVFSAVAATTAEFERRHSPVRCAPSSRIVEKSSSP